MKKVVNDSVYNENLNNKIIKTTHFSKGISNRIYPILQLGNHGVEVMDLQQKLIILNYLFSSTNGYFDENVKEAVINFQKDNNLIPNGTVDNKTWDILNEKFQTYRLNNETDISPFSLTDDLYRFTGLKEGDTGIEVITLQEKLRMVNAYSGSVTGSFGLATTSAVKRFQKENHLSVTGEVDEVTWNTLLMQTEDNLINTLSATPVFKETEVLQTQSNSVLSRPTLRVGDSGPEVRELQLILKQLMYYTGSVDGVFGSTTNVAVRTFQTNNRLSADGIVGRNTWSALIYLYSPLATCGGVPPEEEGSDNIKYAGVVIDSGHGGNDPGAVSSKIIEKDKNLQISKYMANRFNELGIPHSMTRTGDETLSNAERISKLKQPFGDIPNALVVSNHINAGGGEGAEIIYALRNSPKLSTNILNEIGNKGQVKRRVYQRTLPSNPNQDYYYIMRDTNNLETIIIEYGFLDNAKDVHKLENFWAEYAESAVKAITEYMGYEYKLPAMDTGDIYIVKAGDSLYNLAKRFNTSVSEIKRLNALISDNLSIGQELLIPGISDIVVPPIEGELYTVKPGDTLYNLAHKFNMTVAEIKRLNNLTSDTLSVGQKLKVQKEPDVIIPPTEEELYTVKRGDTLYNLAQRFGTSVADIRRLNNLSSDVLSVGQMLIIPNLADVVIPPLTKPEKYIVKSGDTLYSLAKKFNISIAEIRELNNLSSDTLSIGQELIMSRQNGSIIPPISNNYIVKKGDTLWIIANRHNITVNEIKELNNLKGDNLSIGQVLKIPGLRNNDFKEHVVKSGESLWSISNKYNKSIHDIKSTNKLTNNPLYTGQTLKIPK